MWKKSRGLNNFWMQCTIVLWLYEAEQCIRSMGSLPYCLEWAIAMLFQFLKVSTKATSRCNAFNTNLSVCGHQDHTNVIFQRAWGFFADRLMMWGHALKQISSLMVLLLSHMLNVFNFHITSNGTHTCLSQRSCSVHWSNTTYMLTRPDTLLARTLQNKFTHTCYSIIAHTLLASVCVARRWNRIWVYLWCSTRCKSVLSHLLIGF
jgi:hypothetical protein